jgi:hypothetical protein
MGKAITRAVGANFNNACPQLEQSSEVRRQIGVRWTNGADTADQLASVFLGTNQMRTIVAAAIGGKAAALVAGSRGSY